MLFTLMLIKVTSFHIYTHQDNSLDTIENCNICNIAIQNPHAEYLFTAIVGFIFITIFILFKERPSLFVSETPSSFLRISFFGRPPPFIR